MKLQLLILVSLALAGCISIPIPPNGENAGSLGYLTLTLGYKLPKIYSEVYNSPTIRDK
jgi:starvation-inducible outer membrane lipoprotein